MAVQQNKKSPSRRGMRRAHQFLSGYAVATDKETGDRHLRHHISASGRYRKKQIIAPVVDEELTSSPSDQ